MELNIHIFFFQPSSATGCIRSIAPLLAALTTMQPFPALRFELASYAPNPARTFETPPAGVLVHGQQYSADHRDGGEEDGGEFAHDASLRAAGIVDGFGC